VKFDSARHVGAAGGRSIPSAFAVKEYATAVRHSYGLRRAKCEEAKGFPVAGLWTSFNSASHMVSQLISPLTNH